MANAHCLKCRVRFDATKPHICAIQHQKIICVECNNEFSGSHFCPKDRPVLNRTPPQHQFHKRTPPTKITCLECGFEYNNNENHTCYEKEVREQEDEGTFDKLYINDYILKNGRGNINIYI